MTKKASLVLGMVMAAASVVQAGPQVYWGSSASLSVLVNYGATSSATANRLAIGSIVQLIKSSDATIDAINTADPLNPSILGGNDTLVLQSTIGVHTIYPNTAGRFYYGTVDGSVTTVPFALTDYLYMRVFQATGATPMTPGTTIYYAQGSAYLQDVLGVHPSDSTIVPPPVPPTVSIWAPPGTTSSTFFALNKSVTIIPEPAAAGIGLAGVALLAWRRRRMAQG